MSKYKSRQDVPEKYKWNLTDFYKNDDDFDNEYNEALERINYQNKFKGCTKSSNELLKFLKYDEKTVCMVENLLVYSCLKDDEELGNDKSINRKNRAIVLLSEYTKVLSFFSPELISLSKEDYNKLFENKELLDYKFMLDEIYKNKDHVLSENEEKIITELNLAMNNYDEISSNMLSSEHNYGEVEINGKKEEIHTTNIRKILQNKNNKVRRDAYSNFRSVLNNYGGTSAYLLNSYVKANNTISKLHHFKNAWERKLFDRNMPEKAYDILIKTVRDNYESARNYFKLIKKSNNLKEMHSYDLNLSLYPSSKKYTINEGLELIRKALMPLGEDYLKHYDKVINNNYIDFCEYKGKTSGGYSAGTSDHDSRILLSYHDDLDSVSTVIHEVGHNIHGQYIMENNPIVYRNITTLTAEIASLTNKCLLSSYLAENGTKEEKLEGISNILRVIECNLFDCIREAKMEIDFNKYSEEGNSLTKDYLNELNYKSLKEYFKDDITIDENGNTGWITRSHYFNDYYLCDYSFCISAAAANAKKILSGDKKQLERYLNFLKLGSNVYPIDAFKVLGFELTDSKVYEDAIEYFNSLLEEFKEISKE